MSASCTPIFLFTYFLILAIDLMTPFLFFYFIYNYKSLPLWTIVIYVHPFWYINNRAAKITCTFATAIKHLKFYVIHLIMYLASINTSLFYIRRMLHRLFKRNLSNWYPETWLFGVQLHWDLIKPSPPIWFPIMHVYTKCIRQPPNSQKLKTLYITSNKPPSNNSKVICHRILTAWPIP